MASSILTLGGEAAFFDIARRSGRSTQNTLLRDFHPELFDQEGPAVGGFFDDFCGRFAGAVTRFGFDADQSWFVAALRGLKRGREFETVRRHDTIVMIGGCDEGRRITAALWQYDAAASKRRDT